MRRALLLVFAAVPSLACGSEAGAPAAPPTFEPVADGLAAGCHPLRSAGYCSMPFPSDFWMADDPGTVTGRRVALTAEGMPPSAVGGPLDPTRWNELDGFSWATPILAWFPERLDPASLTPYADLARSITPEASTVVVDMETGELMPHFAELDESAFIADDEAQPLMIHPARHLTPRHRYAVGITRRVTTRGGGSPTPSPGFLQALAGARSDVDGEDRLLTATRQAVAALEAAGVARDDLLLAWDFSVASVEAVTTPSVRLRDLALAEVGTTGLGFTITEVLTDPNTEIALRVRGTFTVPSFLTSDSRTDPNVEFHRGSDGLPARRGLGEYPFDLAIPVSARERGPLPLLIYGHGLLGSALDGFSGHVRQFCNTHGYVCIGTDLIGLSEAEAAGVGANAAALDAIKDVTKMKWLSDRLQQGLINTVVLVRTAPAILADARTFVDAGAGPVSAHAPDEPTVYYGISQGGIFGASFMALTPDIQRGVLQVGGSGFSLFVQRSVNWNEFFPAIRNGYFDRRDQQVVLALWQPLLDFAEGSGTAWSQGIHPPLPGTTEKALLFQIAVGDSQVPNIGSEIQARTLGTPLLTPTAREVWGLATTTGSVPVAMAYWDLVRTPPPVTNETPMGDNDVHGDIRKLPENQEQTATFLRTGEAVHTCDGPCTFPDFNP